MRWGYLISAGLMRRERKSAFGMLSTRCGVFFDTGVGIREGHRCPRELPDDVVQHGWEHLRAGNKARIAAGGQEQLSRCADLHF